MALPGSCSPPFELDNRGKRSIAVDVSNEVGLSIVHDLLVDADVFVTNYRAGGLERAGLDYESIASRYTNRVKERESAERTSAA